MKFLDAQKIGAKGSGKGEHKMQPGVRAGQSDPRLLRGSRTTSDPRTLASIRREEGGATETKVTPPAETKAPHRAEVLDLAAKHGVDLSTVVGSGVGGSVLLKDVRDAAKRAAEVTETKKTEEPGPSGGDES